MAVAAVNYDIGRRRLNLTAFKDKTEGVTGNSPTDYSWDAFTQWLRDELRYDPAIHDIFLGPLIAMNEPEWETVNTIEEWHSLINKVATDPFYPSNRYLYFYLRTRKVETPPTKPTKTRKTVYLSDSDYEPAEVEVLEDGTIFEETRDILLLSPSDDSEEEYWKRVLLSPTGDETLLTGYSTIRDTTAVDEEDGHSSDEPRPNRSRASSSSSSEFTVYSTSEDEGYAPTEGYVSRPNSPSNSPPGSSLTSASTQVASTTTVDRPRIVVPPPSPPLTKSRRGKAPETQPEQSQPERSTRLSLRAKPQTPISKPGAPTRRAPASAAPEPEPVLELVDIPEDDYEVENSDDDDYGAADLRVVDTYIGSYNTGDDDKSWGECLEFFKINPEQYARQEATKASERKRVPMKKWPGVSVGYFDYQLIGILNLLKFVLNDVPGGFLCDEQGLGKSQQILGLLTLAHNLRRNKTEVKAELRNPGQKKLHNSADSDARTCSSDDKFGFKCYCYNDLTKQLADRLPEGPNIIMAPLKSCAQVVREAKSKLDTKTFKIRFFHGSAEPADILTPGEMQSIRANKPVLSDFIIVCPFDSATRLAKTIFGANATKPGFFPGIVMLDEFHEYIQSSGDSDSEHTPVVSWLMDVKAGATSNRSPLVYFVSGTPFGDNTISDLRPAISLLEKETWNDPAHVLNCATLESFDSLAARYNSLSTSQSNGELVSPDDVLEFRRSLNHILQKMMVRRLGTDEFRGRKLTNVGPLRVNIMDHHVPAALTEALQALANHTWDLAKEQAGNDGLNVGQLLRSQGGKALMLKLRLASIFPGIADSSADNFNFTAEEVSQEIRAAGGNVSKTKYYKHIPEWAAGSAKLATINKTVQEMLSDKTKIDGEVTVNKKLCLISPLDAEATLLYGYLLLKKAQDKNIRPAWIHSGMTQAERQKTLDDFLQLGNAPPNILVATTDLAGTGLNLQRAKYLTVTSPAWTKREIQQAYFRIHRVGQKQSTKLQLLTAKWNPAERLILAKYEGRNADGLDAYLVSNDAANKDDGDASLVARHQQTESNQSV